MASSKKDKTVNLSASAKAKKETTLQDVWDPLTSPKELANLRPHPITGRLIDSLPGTRTKPMRVLCLGMSRTGTMTLFTALQNLGYKPYHMAVAMGSPKTSLNLWTEALRLKYHNHTQGGKKPWGREEFDRILGDYDAVADVPCICFVEELVAAYPEAKVVLSTRDVEGWMKSMQSTAGTMLKWNWDLVAPWDGSLAGPFWEHAKTVMPIHFRTLNDFAISNPAPREAFEEHYRLVRRTVPVEKLLEFRVQEGWGPLCEFLGVEVPDKAFPRVNDAQQFITAHRVMWWLAFGKMVGKVGAVVAVPVISLVVAMGWYRR